MRNLIRGAAGGLIAVCLTGVVLADDNVSQLQPSSFDYPAPEPGSYQLPPIKPAADGEVLDERGNAVSLLSRMKGRITLLSFFYGSCDDAHGCPLAISALMGVYEVASQDEDLRKDLKIVSQSFDPARDTPQTMARMKMELLEGARSAPEWEFLVANSEATIDPVLAAYGQSVMRSALDDLEKIAHLLRVYLIDRHGMIRNIYGVAFMNPDVLLADVRTLLLEEAGRAAKPVR